MHLCFVFLSQIPNIDFEGLFGNMQMVIKVSRHLLTDLEISDTIGMSPCCYFRNRFCFFSFSFVGDRRRALVFNGFTRKMKF